MANKLLVLAVILCLLLPALSALAATFTDDTQTEFDAGVYGNTVWDTNHVELSPGQTSGTFTSQVFDGGAVANWSQISWSETLISVDKLITVDVTADVWKSVDNAAAWSLVKDDYNGTDGNNAIDMVIDGNENLWILNNQDVWKSTDKGASWTKINDDYNGSETQNGAQIARDGGNNLYIAEADEDIWYSADGGVNWTKQAVNINGGVGNIGGFVGVGSSLYAADAASDVWKSTDSGINWTLVKDDYNGTDGNGVSHMTASTTGNLYIVDSQDVWKSTDAGVSWTKINNDYNGGETQNAVVMTINSSGHLFIAETDEDVWRSADDGVNWTKQGANINGGNGNIVGMAYVSVSTDITFAARSGNVNPPTDSFSGSLTNPSGGAPGVSDARYFQYQASFSTEDSGIIPELSSVTVTYTAGTPTPTSSGSPTPTPTPTPTPVETPVVEQVSSGGGGNDPTRIVFSGKAFPGATVGIYLMGVEYGQVLIDTEFKTQSDGSFKSEIVSPVEEQRLYGLLVKDKEGKPAKSKFFTYNLKFNTIVRQENIILAPTIKTNKPVFVRNEFLLVSGDAAPGNTVEALADGKVIDSARADDSGFYEMFINTNNLMLKIYNIQTRQIDSVSGKTSDVSETRIIKVGSFAFANIDFNQDGQINISDWSVFLSNWSSVDSNFRTKADLNGDGKLDVSDFSVFLVSFQLSQGH
ncbi:MAG: hypothetical protein A3G51_00570 [Candidatus Yanofskybacteria bacterium RIFCSPLOWO2_12_FULL_43_11b]|uniref:Uncharacterized protein n=1 Tax=Candidatus Yanofskybacteria bacterium RIFCSPLOWO2_12_FULL_43_11b TaxID=1802710 RepID=A0A1F8H8R4_9BACT|nr:MAG: hypothetical protein A2742_02860 [Candidatus Yanofskybacteria bacterium RIFCSPHIGHO2_01_FULL_43_32]OGN25096.1 MAG: hypothetical protein A2923_01815 [Candidatus Yanofskybacteria bacterium RIFCSPLOWO2_01_FULL_43_46]OGN33971.1 MAG: hypothetical protein A3G51_00570 [Candidatus Yanofskybacteria bacterium RIFCSPLOWO2_12_FULL_43_11b]